LQGLLNFNCKSEVYVYDVSGQSINFSKKKLEKYPNPNLHELVFSDNLDDFPSEFDLIILSTTAKNRSNLIEMLNFKFNIKSLVFEKVLAQSSQEIILIEESLKHKKNVVVNTPRRVWPLYSKLKSFLTLDFPKQMNIIVSFGIACNAIHFIDLFAWLT
jgi:hypothetical protein